MNLTDSRSLITRCAERMDTLGGGVVFDEWAIITLGGAGAKLAAYQGPRVESFRQRFNSDSRPLLAELEGRNLAVGEFAFVPEAPGTAYDACVRIGPTAYLWWNNTTCTLEDLRTRGSWLPAQKVFADLCEVFRRDPLNEA